MQIKGLKDEDFVNYKKPSMFIIFPSCSFKCDKENKCNLCQNSHLAQEPVIEMSINNILHRYNQNELTKAIVCGGLEPFDTDNELLDFIDTAREYFYINDDIVIYTGYTEEELKDRFLFKQIIQYPNIIIKFGRFRPNEEPHYDEVLGIKLASSNQYAKRYN
jgi:organic radical activating enzyme